MHGSMVTDHVYVSRSGEPWDLCVCGISRPAHERDDTRYPTADLPYRCPYCVDRRIAVCEHGREGALDQFTMQPLGEPQ